MSGAGDGRGPGDPVGGQAEAEPECPAPGTDAPGTGAAGADPSESEVGGPTPAFLAYVVGPIALVMLLVLRQFGLVARVPVVAYALAILGPQLGSRLLERWNDARPGSIRLHVRVIVHVVAVTWVIYLSGWGPALGMAFAFSALVGPPGVGRRHLASGARVVADRLRGRASCSCSRVGCRRS